MKKQAKAFSGVTSSIFLNDASVILLLLHERVETWQMMKLCCYKEKDQKVLEQDLRDDELFLGWKSHWTGSTG